MCVCGCVLAAQLCLTLFNPMDCSPSGSSLHGDSPGKNAGVGCHALLQGIFPTQGPNPGLLHCRLTVYRLSHQGSPRYCRNTLYTLFPVILTSPSKCIGSYDYYPYFTGKEAKTERKKKVGRTRSQEKRQRRGSQPTPLEPKVIFLMTTWYSPKIYKKYLLQMLRVYLRKWINLLLN